MEVMDKAPTMVHCPICNKKTAYASTNPSRPFCSERCKLIDLGKWAAEEYKVPTEAPPEGASAEDNED